MRVECVCVAVCLSYRNTLNLSGKEKKSIAEKLAWIGGVGGYDTSNLNEAIVLNNNAHCTCSAYKVLSVKWIQEDSGK